MDTFSPLLQGLLTPGGGRAPRRAPSADDSASSGASSPRSHNSAKSSSSMAEVWHCLFIFSASGRPVGQSDVS